MNTCPYSGYCRYCGYTTEDGKVIGLGIEKGKAPVAILETVWLGSKTVIRNRLSTQESEDSSSSYKP